MMKMLARQMVVSCALLSACPAHSSAPDLPDAVDVCRARHADHPPAHIACLEREVRARPAASEKTGLGAEQVRASRSDETDEQTMVVIEKASYGLDGAGTFRMADGQVWKASERTPPEQRLDPGKRYSARIERGKLGGYRMYIDGIRRMIKVRRIE